MSVCLSVSLFLSLSLSLSLYIYIYATVFSIINIKFQYRTILCVENSIAAFINNKIWDNFNVMV